MLSIAAYSEVLTNFGGGVGQIAIHGTNARGSVGKEASNGCIRLYNEDIVRLRDLAPTGTPVEIVA
jgi:lipoprotein-anchoring transpeptidase ErfK/SrfK